MFSINRDIKSNFSKYSSLKWKVFHESFIVKNGISFRNIDFERSYVIKYEIRKQKEEFDMLKHSKRIPFLEYFDCKCFRKISKREFHPHLWNYDNRHDDCQCPFLRRCQYFKLLQSVDKTLPAKEKLGSLNKKGSLMRFKKLFRTLKPDYDIFFWVKNMNDTGTSIYKDEVKLLFEFKKYIFRKGKKKKINILDTGKLIDHRLKKIEEHEEYQLKSPEWHPVSPS
jgi:hypothetical protein